MHKGFIPSACIKDKSRENRQRDVKKAYDFFPPKHIRSSDPDKCHGSCHSVCDLTLNNLSGNNIAPRILQLYMILAGVLVCLFDYCFWFFKMDLETCGIKIFCRESQEGHK